MTHPHPRFGRLAALTAAAVCGVVGLAACGSDDKAADDADAGTIRVTTLGLCNEIPVFWAQDKGIFDDHDVTVELVKSTGGAAALTALQSGDIDLAFTNPFSTMIAISQSLKLSWIATAYETTTVESEGTNAIAVAKDSGITEAKDLDGTTVAVNEIGGINQIIMSQWMKLKGGDPESAKFVALPFNELASAVASGKVAAAQVPAQNIDPKLGLVSLGDPYVVSGEGKPLVFAGYVATEEAAESNAAAFEAFQSALIEADEQLNKPENAEEKYAIEARECKQDAAVLATLPENIYEARVDTDALSRMGDILEDQGLVDDAADPADYVPDYVVTK